MRRCTSVVLCAALGMGLLAAGGCTLILRPHPRGAVLAQPRLTLIAGTGIYWTDDYEEDIFRYGGKWYWCDGPYWYTSHSWGGRWSHIKTPPAVFLKIPSTHPRFSVVFRHPHHTGYHGYMGRHYGHYSKPVRARAFSRRAKAAASSRPTESGRPNRPAASPAPKAEKEPPAKKRPDKDRPAQPGRGRGGKRR